MSSAAAAASSTRKALKRQPALRLGALERASAESRSVVTAIAPAPVQSSTILPHSPRRMVSKPGQEFARRQPVGDDLAHVEAALQHRDHLVPGLEHLAPVDALDA